MKGLSQQRCFLHAEREAAAVCLECGRFFCRECVTEHEDRVVCASCLKRLSQPSLFRRLRLAWLGEALGLLLALCVVWGAFYGLGRALLQIPSQFHEGTLWEKSE